MGKNISQAMKFCQTIGDYKIVVASSVAYCICSTFYFFPDSREPFACRARTNNSPKKIPLPPKIQRFFPRFFLGLRSGDFLGQHFFSNLKVIFNYRWKNSRKHRSSSTHRNTLFENNPKCLISILVFSINFLIILCDRKLYFSKTRQI